MEELWFLHSAWYLMSTDIYMKFREDSLNSFQVIERTWFWGGQKVSREKLKKYKCKRYGSCILNVI